MRDSEEIRFLEGTCRESGGEIEAAESRERVEASKRKVRWSLGALVWALVVVPPAIALCVGSLASPAGQIAACGFAATAVVALVFTLKRLMGR